MNIPLICKFFNLLFVKNILSNYVLEFDIFNDHEVTIDCCFGGPMPRRVLQNLYFAEVRILGPSFEDKFQWRQAVHSSLDDEVDMVGVLMVAVDELIMM